jgi:hypothetical protein
VWRFEWLDARWLPAGLVFSSALDALLPDLGGQADVSRSGAQELVVVDAAVEDYEQLLADLVSERDVRYFDVAVLDPDVDGVDELTRILGEYEELDAVHVVSHASAAGAVQLGNTWLTLDNLDAYAAQFARWGRSLQAEADLLFYGCSLAATADGRALVETIAQRIGADVAASVDDTGHPQLGGDWDLEFTTGPIETAAPLSAAVQANWFGLLANPTGPEFRVNAGTLGTQTTGPANAQAVAMDAAGNFVVAWTTSDLLGLDRDVYAQRFDASGTPLGSERTERLTR